MANGQGPDRRRLAVVIAVLLIVFVAIWLSRPSREAPAGVTSPAAKPAASAAGDVATVAGQNVADEATSSVDSPESDVVVEECPPPLTPEQVDARNARLQAELATGSEILASTDDSEHQLAAAMLKFREETPRAMAMLKRAAVLDPANKLVAPAVLMLCSQRNVSGCAPELLEEMALDADPENGHTWLQIGISRLIHNDNEAAVEAFRNAIAKPQFDSYYYEQFALLERGWASSTNLSLPDRVIAAMGVVAAMPMPINVLMNKCKDETSGVWPELCEQVGRRMTVEGRDLISQGIGMALQEAALENLDDQEGLARVKRENAAVRAVLIDLERADSMYNMLLNDSRLLQNYLENFGSYGEVEAMRRAQAEYLRLKGSPDYNQCNFSGNPYGE